MGNANIQGNGRLTKRVKIIEGEEYRVVDGYPLDGNGDICCPRCSALISEQKDEVTVVQYSYIQDMDRYQYGCLCRSCNLRYVWSDEVKG